MKIEYASSTAWEGKILITAPDGRQVPVDNEISPQYCMGFNGKKGHYVHRENRNRVLVEKSSRVFIRYAALENLIDYRNHGFTLEGNIWFDQRSENQKKEVARIREMMSSEFNKAKCVIL